MQKLGPGRWRVFTDAPRGLDGGRRRVTRVVRGTKRDAEEALAKLVVSVGRGDALGGDHTVGELLDAYLATADLSPSSRRDVESAVRRWLRPNLGHLRLDRLRPLELTRWYRQLVDGGLGAPRVAKLHAILRAALGRAVEWEWIARNPAQAAHPPAAPRPKRPVADPAHVAALAAHLATAEPSVAAWLIVAEATGARRGELCALRWEHVDLDGATMAITGTVIDGGPGVGVVVRDRTKTGAARVVPLSDAAVAALRSHRARMAAEALVMGVPLAGFVWSRDPEGNLPWRPEYPSVALARACKRLGLPRLAPHSLRRLLGTELVADGIDPRTVAGILGHARPSTTIDIYAAPVTAAQRAAIERRRRRSG